MAITTDKFITGVKRRITIPANQSLLGDSDILDIADDSISEDIMPMLIAAQQNYFVYPAETALVPGQESYPIPYRAVGRGLRDLKISIDGTTSGINSLTQIELEHRYQFALSGNPVGYFFQGDKIILVPTPESSSQLLMYWYEVPPNKLVLPTKAAKVTSISVGATNTDIVVDLVPNTFLANTEVDIIQGKSGNSILNFDSVITNIAGTTLTFVNAAVSTDIVVGDYIALSGESPVIQIPNEARSLLETLTGIGVLEAIGDFDGANALSSKMKSSMDNFKKLIEPRNQGSTRKIVQGMNSLLRGRSMSFFNNRLFY